MDREELKPGFEYVHTVTEYHDGPRRGIADYQGRPHLYECIFDQAKGEYSDLFWLAPVESETFQLAMEDWGVWSRWELAYKAGNTGLDSHPTLPREAARHKELQGILQRILVIDPLKAIARIGRFEVHLKATLPPGILRPLQVIWSEPPPSMSVPGV